MTRMKYEKESLEREVRELIKILSVNVSTFTFLIIILYFMFWIEWSIERSVGSGAKRNSEIFNTDSSKKKARWYANTGKYFTKKSTNNKI